MRYRTLTGLLGAATLSILLFIPAGAQAQPKPANMTTTTPAPYVNNAYPFYGRTYTSYTVPPPNMYSVPVWGSYNYMDPPGMDPGFRLSYYNPGPANYWPTLHDYYASPRYFNYYSPGFMR